MSRRNKIALGLIILLGVVIFGYSLRDVKLNILIRDFTTIHQGWLLTAVLCMLVYFALEAWWSKFLWMSGSVSIRSKVLCGFH